MNAGSGPPSPQRSAQWTHDPDCSCSRTSLGCSLSTGGQPYPRSPDRWPSWGTWDATGFTALPRPEPPTSASAGSSLLLTPTANLASNGGSQTPEKRRAGGHGPTLADQIEQHLFPTPRASDGPHGSPKQTGTGLVPVVTKLFPTPRVQGHDGGGGPEKEIGGKRPSGTKRAVNVATVVGKLFPTPACGGGGESSRSGTRKDELLLQGIVRRLFPTPRVAATRTSRTAVTRKDSRSGPSLDQVLELLTGTLPRELQDISEAPASWQIGRRFPTPAARDWKGPSLRGPGTIRSDTGKPRTAQQTDLPSAVLDLTGRNTSRQSAGGN